ncbi:glycosyltransferase family 2 protein [Pseudokineococcus basanitobsidens]|uniref:Glycosyltransferase family 2 protein n=1 Tax=Pseudokineococcus basanitobsidens TaxID=1926649 RepID=A0ABU8RM30_9ACTN
MTLLTCTALVVAAVLTAIAGSTLRGALHAWRTPEAFEGSGYPAALPPSLSFSLVVPCRHEAEEVVRATLERLLRQGHPDVQVVISVGHDDPATSAVAHRLAGEAAAAAAVVGRRREVLVSVNGDLVKNKPRQLNTALPLCTGDVVGVIDAESLTHPDLLERVDGVFQARQADVVQGSVHLVNFRDTWFALRNCLEYRTWFRSRLHGAAQVGFVPLGGNTVFTRRALLEEVGGWDPDCLAEDCEIGVRLSTMGKKIVCVYDPALTTREEAPDSLRSLVKQRTRWSLGFMQVLAKGEWRRLPGLRRRATAWWTLVQPHAMAFTGLVLPFALVVALTAQLPTAVAMLLFVPLVPTLLTVGFETVILREFGHDLGFRVRWRDQVVLVLTTPLYQVVLAAASVRALWRFVGRDFTWEKTRHSGAHLGLTGAEATAEGAA